MLGIVLFAGSWLARYELQQTTENAILDTIIIDSKESSGYKGWSENFGADRGSSNLHQYFYFCNITNVADVVNKGALPIVQEVGPYYYWQKRINIDVTFPEGGDKVSYNTWTRFDFMSDKSIGTEDDVIHSVNPAYLGAVALAGGELNLLVGATGPSIKIFFDFMWSTFVPDFVQQSVPAILTDAMKNVTTTTGMSRAEFLAVWANHTDEADKLWEGLLVSANSTSGSSDISATSALALFNASRPASLLDHSWNGTQLWRQAIQGDATARTALGADFTLTERQVGMVCSWLSTSFYEHYTLPNVTTLWGVDSVSDLAYLQWGMGLLSPDSVSALYPGAGFPATPELALYWLAVDKFGSLDLETSKQVLAGPYGVFQATNVAALVAAAEAALKPPFNTTLLYERWGLTIDDASTFMTYFGYMTENYARTVLDDTLAKGGGLFTARTVREWLWEGKDPLLELVAPTLASKSVLVGNETSPDEARARHNVSVSWTGKRNIADIGGYIEWEGETVLRGVYAKDIPVSGVNNMGQFAPFRDLSSKLYTWDNYYMRPVTLVPTEMVELKGVRMIRYLVDNETWAVNETLYNSIPGFANMTGAYYGATVFLSNPHMLGANTSWPSLISGFALPDASKDTTIIDVEPNSGTITHYDEGLEINVYLDPKSSYFSLYYPNVRRGVMVPVVWTREFGLISDKDAKAVRDALYFAFDLRDEVFWSLLAVGAFLLVLSVPSVFVLLRCYRKSHSRFSYHAVGINDGDSLSNPREGTALDDFLS